VWVVIVLCVDTTTSVLPSAVAIVKMRVFVVLLLALLAMSALSLTVAQEQRDALTTYDEAAPEGDSSMMMMEAASDSDSNAEAEMSTEAEAEQSAEGEGESFAELQQRRGGKIKKAFKKVGKAVKKAGKAVVKGAKKLLGKLFGKKGRKKLSKAAKKALAKAKAKAKKAAKAAKKAAKKAGKALGKGAKKLGKGLKKAAKAVGRLGKKLLNAMLRGGKRGKKALKKALRKARKAGKKAKKQAAKLKAALKKKLKSLFKKPKFRVIRQRGPSKLRRPLIDGVLTSPYKRKMLSTAAEVIKNEPSVAKLDKPQQDTWNGEKDGEDRFAQEKKLKEELRSLVTLVKQSKQILKVLPQKEARIQTIKNKLEAMRNEYAKEDAVMKYKQQKALMKAIAKQEMALKERVTALKRTEGKLHTNIKKHKQTLRDVGVREQEMKILDM